MHKTARFTRRTFTLAVATVGMTLLSVGCAISDYRGFLGHMTSGEAKFFGSQSAVAGDPAYTGTYDYTVKYDFRGLTQAGPTTVYPDVINLFTYRNPTAGAFSRDGCVDRDGDDLQQRPGLQPGSGCDNPIPSQTKFEPLWEFQDRSAGCQFYANYRKTYNNPPNPFPIPGFRDLIPAIVFCSDFPFEEIDKDLSLQGSPNSNLKEAFTSLDDLVAQIWSGALGRSFAMNVTKVTLNGTEVELSNPAAFSAGRNDFRVINGAIDLSSPGVQSLIQAILSNTQDEVPATVALEFEGGLRLGQPGIVRIAFNHDALVKVLQ
jgi:hypothetical protein